MYYLIICALEYFWTARGLRGLIYFQLVNSYGSLGGSNQYSSPSLDWCTPLGFQDTSYNPYHRIRYSLSQGFSRPTPYPRWLQMWLEGQLRFDQEPFFWCLRWWAETRTNMRSLSDRRGGLRARPFPKWFTFQELSNSNVQAFLLSPSAQELKQEYQGKDDKHSYKWDDIKLYPLIWSWRTQKYWIFRNEWLKTLVEGQKLGTMILRLHSSLAIRSRQH